ncbi:MAG: outer membrane beta-barrel protein [Flavobacterium sp.]|nr:outer membrane beta-barrel protein [Flavobacterium sp.]
MKQLYFFLWCLLITTISLAQTSGTIKGKLIDSVGKQSLKDASITVLDSKDSTLEVFGLAKTDGTFELKNIALGKMIVQITFQGYKPVNKIVTLSKENAVVDLGEVAMSIQAKDLQEVIVQTSPITIRKDTIEYNAGSFKTKPNAVVEDLLKKLPGVEVAKDGSIKAQGEAVSRVLVDGKRFFGEDPKMATKNLPPDMVDKIQVYDAQSDQSVFSGFDDGTRTKTINITTKKDRRKGFFGKAMAGGGNNGRYESSLNFNRFNGNQQISFIGQANNVNRQAFSVQDILGTLGSAGGGRGGAGGGGIVLIGGLGGGGSSNGITTTVAGGLNYKDVWSKKTEASGSYFYNNLAIDRDTRSLTETFFSGDSSQFNNQNTTARTKNQNHRINFNIETQIDSSNSLVVRPNFSYQETEANNVTQSTITKGKFTNIGTTEQNTSSAGSGYNGSIDATFRHRFKTKGRTFSMNVTGGANTNNNDATNFTTANIASRSANQISNSKSDGNNISTNLSYTEPVGKNQLIEIGYNYSYRTNTSNKQTFAYDAATQGFTKGVDSLTNKFENTNASNRASLGYRVQNAKFNLGATMGVQFATLTSNNRSKNINFNNNFVNLFPTANFTYNFTRSKNLRINYSGRTNQPSASQLQPVPDVSDVTNIKNGNPNLSQEFSNNLRIFYSSFDIFKLRNLFAMFNFSSTSNKIVSNVTQSPTTFYRTTTYSNTGGVYSLSGYVNYGFQFGKQKIRLNFTTNLAHSRDVSIIHSPLLANVNDTINYTYNSSIGQTIGTSFNIKEKLDLNLTATSTYYIAKNTNQVSAANNTNYFTQNITIEPTYTFKGGWVLGTDLDYNYTGGLATGYNASVPLWNVSLSKLLFKNQAGELKVAIYDMLNQNVSVSRSVTGNTVTDQQSTVLKQYFSVTFAYNLRKFAGAGQQMPSMFRNMMRGTNMRNMPRF